VLRDTVTDNSGGTAFDTVEVRVSSTGNLAPLAGATVATGMEVTTGTVTRTGGTTDGGVLQDASDATYLTVTSGGSVKVRCVPITTRTGMAVTFRLSTPDSGQARVSLYQGATLIQQSTALTLTGSAADYVLSVTSWASVTDPGNLWVLIEAL
jgi:hypothetical protein